MTHVEFEYHFAKEAERFGISKFIRENNKVYDFQSFMLALSGIVTRNEPVDDEKLDDMAENESYKSSIPNDWCQEYCYQIGFKAGYRKAKEE